MTNRATPQPCAGPCSRRWREAEAKKLPHDIRPYLGNPYWCEYCRARVLRALGELPELIAAIHLEALHGTARPGGEKVTASTAPAWPGQSARLLTDWIVGGLGDIEAAMRELRNWSAQQAAFEPNVLNAAVTALALNVDWFLVDHPLAADPDLSPGVAILDWHRKAERFTGRDRLVHRFPVRCPSCDLLALQREDGDAFVECTPRLGGCGRLWNEEEYGRLVVVAASDLKGAA